MGISGISPMSLLLILLIVVALFGTEKLKQLGGDLGKAIKNFQNAMKDDDPKS
jgi:sec-independent protein translocase protein TatA